MTGTTLRLSGAVHEFSMNDVILHNNRPYLVVRESEHHGVFSLRGELTSYAVWEGEKLVPRYQAFKGSDQGVAYYPIAEGMTADDIRGATYAEWNGTAWLFAHCSPDEQVDFAAECKTWTEQQFMLALADANVKIAEATNTVVRNRALVITKAISEFANVAGHAAYTEVVEEVLGRYHHDPHHDHKREIAIRAIDAALEDWAEKGKTDVAILAKRSAALPAINTIKALLKRTHAIEWRHARVTRLTAEAEKKKKEAEAAEAQEIGC